ncbi:MAG: protein translocase subunit SecF [Candidatus Moranbacteria bacterium CG_4_10_14_3_um_filter_41_65]|nr:MAG: protein-export membrane protein SecF [Candidatus Moranbacteria bacterium CG2_30_41_165]PIW94382.1 MAG: protein translocase subunit SecF [Candidatus Moranbacteria bacterium CG_4_8_14_3_um_filter_41_13]PIX91416.1 MAG: protein translocase subunit SecF [Candidatus Moranbacteria bacterium CG_4_10_14_3_um_filter_41_65]
MLNIIQKRVYTYIFSIITVVMSIFAISFWGLNLGIDFKGGTLMEIQFSKTAPAVPEVTTALADITLQSLTIQPTGENTLFLRYLASDETVNEQVLEKLKTFDTDLKLLRTDFIGGSVSDQIKKQAIIGIILSVIGIALYIAWAFRRVSGAVTSFEFGLSAIIALIHDIVITIGIFAFLGKFYGIEVGVPFVAALLTILGYSVNDTIVVYDRVRENLLRAHKKEDFEITVNRSLNETLGRSFSTSFTVMITLLAITLFGGESIRYFTLAILVGVAFGTYSSVYVASALLVTRYKMKMNK